MLQPSHGSDPADRLVPHPGEQIQCDLRLLGRPGGPAVTPVVQSMVTHRQSEVGAVEGLLQQLARDGPALGRTALTTAPEGVPPPCTSNSWTSRPSPATAEPLRLREGPENTVYVENGETVRLLMKFGPHQDRYRIHCHHLVHEDHDIMAQSQCGKPQTPDRQRIDEPFVNSSLIDGTWFGPIAVPPRDVLCWATGEECPSIPGTSGVSPSRTWRPRFCCPRTASSGARRMLRSAVSSHGGGRMGPSPMSKGGGQPQAGPPPKRDQCPKSVLWLTSLYQSDQP